MQLEPLVNEYYDTLSFNEKLVMNYILGNQHTVLHKTSEEVAAACGVTRPTLLRALKKLHIHSFSELKFLLQQEQDQHIMTLDLNDVIDHYQYMINDIFTKDMTSICDALYHAHNIYIYGTGNEQKSIAEELKRMLFSQGKALMDFYDYGEASFYKELFSKDDLFIVISLSGETAEAINIIRMVSTSNIQLLSITRLKNNHIARMCHYSLYIGTKTIPIQPDEGYEIMSSFYVLLDHLFIQYLYYIGGIQHDL